MSLVEAAAQGRRARAVGFRARAGRRCAKSGRTSSNLRPEAVDYRERAVAYRAIGQFRFRQKLELLRRGLDDESPAARGSALAVRPAPVEGQPGRRERDPARSAHDRDDGRESSRATSRGPLPAEWIRPARDDRPPDRTGRGRRAGDRATQCRPYGRGRSQEAGGTQGLDLQASPSVLLRLAARMRMRLEVQLATPPIGHMCVQLGRRKIRMPEHLLNRT